MFYLRFDNLEIRTKFIKHMKDNDIMCVFHDIPLHSSPAGQKHGRVSGEMTVTNKVSDTLVRLPLYYGMDEATQDYVISKTLEFLNGTI